MKPQTASFLAADEALSDKQFHRLARDEAAMPAGFAIQLSKAYRYKEIADYETGVDAVIEPARARAAIATAEHFVALVRASLTPPPAQPIH